MWTSRVANREIPISSQSESKGTNIWMLPRFPCVPCQSLTLANFLLEVCFRRTMAVGGTWATFPWSRMYAANSLLAPSPGRVPFLSPSPEDDAEDAPEVPGMATAGEDMNPRGLFSALGSSSSGLKTATFSPRGPSRK